MSKIIIVNLTPEETRSALLENGELLEVSVERCAKSQTVGNIYKGKIRNMLPGMQAAFIDIGRERNAFLYIGKTFPYIGGPTETGQALSEGQDILVQVIKDAIGSKGPRVTAEWNVPGRYVVLMPTAKHIGVSRRIADEAERERLHSVAEEVCPSQMGMIVRTVAEGKTAADMRKDVEYLDNLTRALLARAKRATAPTLLYRDVDLVIRIVRDDLKDDIDEFVLDSPEAYQRVRDLLSFSAPEMAKRVHLYQAKQDIFASYGVDTQLEELRQREVWLKCGGYLVIDHTEALTVIDVNTGKFVGNTNLAQTVYQTNQEAVAEIARQIRLRDIGGMILIDFIDMNQQEHRQTILRLLEENLAKDRTRTNVHGFTALGLVEMTRKKVRQDMASTLHEPCPYCSGRGRILSPETMAIRIVRQLRQLASGPRLSDHLMIQVPTRLAAVLPADEIARLEQELSLSLKLEFYADMHPETFSILRGE